MKTFKQFIFEANIYSQWLKRDQGAELNDRSEIHKEVLTHFGDDDNKLKNAIQNNSNEVWTLAQHMENHPNFQQRVLTHLKSGYNVGDKMRANFLQDRLDVNNYLRDNHPKLFNDIRDGNKKWDSGTSKFVPRNEDDPLPGHPDFKPPKSPEEALKRISDPNHVEHNPYLANAIKAVAKTRPSGYRFTQPSFAVSGDEWFGK